MLRASVVLPAGSFQPSEAIDTVVLDYDDRRRRRMVMQARGGLEFLLDLAETPALAAGDGLRLEDGRVVAVAAEVEKLAEFRFSDGDALARVAWHLGNRHTPTEFGPMTLRIRDDHVLTEMVKKLGGAEIALVGAPFTPEGGAYGVGGTMGHDHGHAHGHAHSHSHAEAHSHDHGHDHGHSHDHDHDHGHGHGATAAPLDVDAEALAAAQARRAARQAARAAATADHVHGPDCGCADHDHHHGHDHGHHAHGHEHGHDHDHDHHHDHDHDHGHEGHGHSHR